MVGDEYARTFPIRWPNVYPVTSPVTIYQTPPSQQPHQFAPTQDALRECAVCGEGRDYWLHALWEPEPEPISREDFEALKSEVQELKALLLAAKRFDEATDQADCEMDEKVELIRRVADLVGIDVDDVFGSRE